MNNPRSLAVLILLLLGLDSPGRAADLFERGSTWRYLPGRTEASPGDTAAWRKAGFDDRAWKSGPAPFYYGQPVTGTELSDMRGNYSSVFLRREFTTAKPNDVAELRLGAVADDGFIAWINGREVARHNVPEGELAFNATALGAVAEPLPFETFVITNAPGLLVTGANVLAVQVFNASLSDSPDLLFDASLGSVLDTDSPVVEQIVPAPGSTLAELFAIEVRFSEAVNGVEATDLLVNGAPAIEVREVVEGQFRFSFAEPPAGKVNVAWRADHGITDRAFTPHPFTGKDWSYQLDSTNAFADISIAEFMASNAKTLNDEDGENSDWIELYNAGDSLVSLKDWFLTDESTNLTKWRFPDVALPGKSFLVVFASGKNKTNSLGRLHTNFKLAEAGEYLALVSAAKNIISDFSPAYPKQSTDVSFGRVPGAPGVTGYFTKATPGAANASSGADFAPTPDFSRGSGTFIQPFALSITLPATNAVIRYTLDGKLPTNGSPVYVAPLLITNTVQVRARAFTEGLLPGLPRSASFVMLSNSVVDFVSDLPVMILHTLGNGTPSDARQTMTHISIHEPVNGRASMTNPPSLVSRGALKVRGSSTGGLPKASWAMEFWDEFDQGKDVSPLGMPADPDWVLYAPNEYDPVMIHNPFLHRLSRETGMYSSRTRFIEVYFSRNTGGIASNHYNGIYVLEEKIKIAKDRVNIDKLEPEHVNLPEVTGGFLLKVDRLDPGDSGLSAGGQSLAYIDPKERELKTPQRAPQRTYLIGYLNSFAKALAATTWRDPVVGYPAYIDVNNWIEFHVLEVLSGNVDAMVLSTYLHKPRNGKITYGPHWDFDRALGSTDGRDANPRLWQTGPFFSAPWWSTLYRDADFWQKFADRYQSWRQNHLSNTNLNKIIDELSGEIRQAQPRDQAKWRRTLRRPDGKTGGGATYDTEVQWMKNWLSNRMDFIDRQISPLPLLSRPAGQVTPGSALTLSGALKPAVILYTLDGSDPRLSGGGISPKAITNTGPISVTSNIHLIARSYNLTNRLASGGPTGPQTTSSPWSSPADATYTVEAPVLTVTEVMFHPVAGAVEYVELKNTSGRTLDLTGYRFVNGIDFTFGPGNGVNELAPGARVVVTGNRAAFALRYPVVKNVAGDYLGSLGNGGNRLRLVGPVGEPVFDFTYNDHWQMLADGFGFALVLANEAVGPDQLGNAGNWRLSANLGGSPGESDPALPVLPRVVVNEAAARPVPPQTDAIELYNTETTSADVSGWWLTDDFRAPKKYRIANGTSLAAKSFLVLTESQFSGNGTNGFALSSLGDEVYLFSADAKGALTGWVHGFGFGASASGESFGCVVTSTGAEHFVAQTRPTLGTANAGPRVGPVIVSGIMYAPVDVGVANNTADEYVELHNLSSDALALFDPAHPANTWRLRGGVNFDFPADTRIPANGMLTVVSFDPRVNLGALQNFRARYGLPDSTLVTGPWTGRFNNAGDTLRLEKPDSPLVAPAVDAGFVPYILVEEVAFGVAAPWPADAHGTGRALHRAGPPAYANDPASWTSGWPHPGVIDNDEDGLPDDWEIANGFDPKSAAGIDGGDGDADGDGFTNRQEMLAGTSPRDAKSYLRLEAARTGTLALNLKVGGAPNRSYTVEYKEKITTGWQFLRIATTDASGSILIPVTLPTAGERYYRVTAP